MEGNIDGLVCASKTNRCKDYNLLRAYSFTASQPGYKEFGSAALSYDGCMNAYSPSMSDDSMRKMSNDSGISAMSSRAGRDSPGPLAAHADDLIGEPRLSTMQILQAQQSLTAAASLNPGLLGLSANTFLPSSGLSSLWSNQLTAAAIVQQQQEATRKVLESANGKSSVRPFKQYPKDALNFPLYPIPVQGLFSGMAGGISAAPSVQDQHSLADALKAQEQMISAYKRQVLNAQLDDRPLQMSKMAARKSHSFSGSSSPLALQQVNGFSSPGSATEPPAAHHTSPGSAKSYMQSEEPASRLSYQGEDDRNSVMSSKSSSTSADLKCNMSTIAGQPAAAVPENLSHLATLPVSNRKESTRRRKFGVIGSELDLGLVSGSQSASSVTSAPPMSKLSTASLPANLPSANRNASLSRKRPRTLPDDEKDDLYWERRRKNNEAAKRSRDSRRAKEDEIAIRAAFLEQENLRLRLEMANMKQELDSLKNELDVCQKKKAKSRDSSPPTPPADNS